MAEMTAADAAEKIEEIRDCLAEVLKRDHENALDYALSLCRKVAAGKLREVVHGKWALARESERCYLVKCTNCGHSVAIAANVPIDEWRAAHSYCVDCGALMDGKGGSDGQAD